jgi:hypothetical protein
MLIDQDPQGRGFLRPNAPIFATGLCRRPSRVRQIETAMTRRGGRRPHQGILVEFGFHKYASMVQANPATSDSLKGIRLLAAWQAARHHQTPVASLVGPGSIIGVCPTDNFSVPRSNCQISIISTSFSGSYGTPLGCEDRRQYPNSGKGSASLPSEKRTTKEFEPKRCLYRNRGKPADTVANRYSLGITAPSQACLTGDCCFRST